MEQALNRKETTIINVFHTGVLRIFDSYVNYNKLPFRQSLPNGSFILALKRYCESSMISD